MTRAGLLRNGAPSGGLLVFVGPSLPRRDARRLARCTVLPPARQGDLWRALARRPAAIALVDGVFESVPSVWHHEILDALDAGVAVFGGGSMGALRAAELQGHGMVGVGRIFGWYRDGVITGDDEVALLHAGAEDGYRPLTLPLVTVRRTAEVAHAAGALSRREARSLVAAAGSLFYQERTWRRTLAAAGSGLPPAARERLRAILDGEAPPDPKAEDARATISAAAAFLRGAPAAARDPWAAAPRRRPSSLVRRRKLAESATRVGGALVPSGAVLATLRGDGTAPRLREEGLRRALLAGLARALGLRATARDRAAAGDVFFAARAIPRRRRGAHLAACGLDPADAARLFDDLALEQLLLAQASRAVADGPSGDEGLALGARLSGRWAEVSRRLAGEARRWTRRPVSNRIGRR